MKPGENYIIIDGKKTLLSDETVKELKKTLKEPELPTEWEDLIGKHGFYVDNRSEIDSDYIDGKYDKNIFPTAKEAEACLALSQLCMLRDAYNGESLKDWLINQGADYHCVEVKKDHGQSIINQKVTLLSFKTKELAEKFIDNFKDLIEQAKPLL